MNTFGERVKEIRKELGLSQAAFGKAVGLSQGTVAEIERGDYEESRKTLSMAELAKVNPKWLATGRGPKYQDPLRALPDPKTISDAQAILLGRQMNLDDDGIVEPQVVREHLANLRKSSQTNIASNVRVFNPEDPVPNDIVLIKESEVSFKGGPGHELDYEILEDSEPATYRRSWFQKERLKPDKCVRFRQVGDSNEPFLHAGDTILVNLEENEIRNGRVYAFWQESEGRRCKKLFKKTDGSIVIHSFNPDYPEELLPADRSDEIIIIGRVRDRSGRGGL